MTHPTTHFIGFLLLLLTAISFSGCESESTTIPNREVFLKRKIDDIKLNAPGTYKSFTKPELVSDRLGFGGILVVHAFNGEYYAFDMACPKEVTPTIRIGAPDDMLVSTCSKCGESYELAFGLGTPTKGISKAPLRTYSTYVDEYNYIYVTP